LLACNGELFYVLLIFQFSGCPSVFCSNPVVCLQCPAAFRWAHTTGSGTETACRNKCASTKKFKKIGYKQVKFILFKATTAHRHDKAQIKRTAVSVPPVPWTGDA